MNRQLATFISYLLHPLWVPVLATLIIYRFCSPAILLDASGRAYLLGYIGLFSVLFPLFSLIVMQRLGLVQNLEIPDRKERPLPLLTAAIYLAALSYMLLIVLRPSLLIAAACCATTFTLFVLAGLSLKVKVSLHTAAYTGLSAILLSIRLLHSEYNLMVPFAISLLLVGAVVSARISLGAHSWEEIGYGAATGLICCSGVFTAVVSWQSRF
jgi:hypothetical protein